MRYEIDRTAQLIAGVLRIAKWPLAMLVERKCSSPSIDSAFREDDQTPSTWQCV